MLLRYCFFFSYTEESTRSKKNVKKLQIVKPMEGMLHSFIHLFIRLFIHSFIHSFIHLFIRLFIYSSIHLFFHSFVSSQILPIVDKIY